MQRGLAASANLWFCDLLAVAELTVLIDLLWFYKVSFLMNSKVVFCLWACDLSHRLNRWKQSWILQLKINIQTMTMPDGCNYELLILSAVWTWKAKKAHNQQTNQLNLPPEKHDSLEIGSETWPMNKRIFFSYKYSLSAKRRKWDWVSQDELWDTGKDPLEACHVCEEHGTQNLMFEGTGLVRNSKA